MMTVADLIARLKKLPGDLPVVVRSEGSSDFTIDVYDNLDEPRIVEAYRAPDNWGVAYGNARNPPPGLTLEPDEPFRCVLIEGY